MFYLVNTVALLCAVQIINFMLNAVLAVHERDLNAMYIVHCCCMIEKDVLVSCMTVTSLVPVSEKGGEHHGPLGPGPRVCMSCGAGCTAHA